MANLSEAKARYREARRDTEVYIGREGRSLTSHSAAVMQKEAQAAHYYINALEEHIAIHENTSSVQQIPAEVALAKVGAERSQVLHWGRGSEKDQTFYILHSIDCIESGIDLTTCPYSVALDNTDTISVFEPDFIYLLEIKNKRLRGVKGRRKNIN